MNPSLIKKFFFLPTRCAICQGAKNGEIEILHENENLTILLTMAWRLDVRRGGGLKYQKFAMFCRKEETKCVVTSLSLTLGERARARFALECKWRKT